jgi:hypothetical protein
MLPEAPRADTQAHFGCLDLENSNLCGWMRGIAFLLFRNVRRFKERSRQNANGQQTIYYEVFMRFQVFQN